MFAKYVYEKSAAEYLSKVLLIDRDDLVMGSSICDFFCMQGFQIVKYVDDLHFRTQYAFPLSESVKYLVVALPDDYIPYDILIQFNYFEVSFQALFPSLNTMVVKEYPDLNIDLLSLAYRGVFADMQSSAETKSFLEQVVYAKGNIKRYVNILVPVLQEKAEKAKSYKDWLRIASEKANIDTLATEFEIEYEHIEIHQRFKDFLISDFARLSTIIDRDGPVLVSQAMEYMHENSEKFIIVVMDGMSEFDWRIISKSFTGIRYEKNSVFAMIPTTTTISRQCLLANKYPVQLMEPWKQSKEKAEFIACAMNFGFSENNIEYFRGFDVNFSQFVKCGAIVINDIDDIVHGQKQSRIGMYNDVTVLMKQSKLLNLVKKLTKNGFDVYITSDHGNTPCVGMGKLLSTGVEIETKSRRMLVLRDFANKETLVNQFNLVDYPKYFLNKEYDYLICDEGVSFDAREESVMSHGGITLDEVIVPFIKIKAEDNNAERNRSFKKHQT